MKKNIFIVTRNMHAGGAERVIAQLANYLVKNQIKCSIITVDEANVSYRLDNKIDLISIGKKSSNKVIDRLKRYKNVRQIITNAEADVVLSMPEEIGIYVIAAMLGSRIPVYVSERNNPWVMPDQKITRLLRKLMYPFAAGIIFQTKMARSFFCKSIQKKGVVLHNPVDRNRIPDSNTGQREKVIVSAGRLDKQKNFDLLIESFKDFSKIHPEYKLRIFGDGCLRQELENKIALMGLRSKVELPGRKDNLLELMKNASMYVLSSDYEGMPNVLIEAMCMGMPVISTDCPSGGPRELIKNNVNGILVPVRDKKAMVEAMCKMTDKKTSEMMANKAYQLKDMLVDKKIFIEWKDYLFGDK